jgi:HD-like signal output (HDOD) protein
LNEPAHNSATDTVNAMRHQLTVLIDRRSLELPPMPGVAAEVIASSLDDHADAARLARLIETDQGLTGHVLRIVNSPALRAATEIVALRQAIGRLGMNRIREIALAAALSNSLFAQSCYPIEAKRAWQRALCAGLWAKEIARVCRKNTEMSYLCGLLHNVGTPVVLNALGRGPMSHLAEADLESLVTEFGACAGTLLARDWKLPEAVVATVRFIDDFAAAAEHADHVAIANCAMNFARLMERSDVPLESIGALESIRHLNLYPDDVATLLDMRDVVRTSIESIAA